MTPGKYNLDIYRGDTYRWQFLLWIDVDKTLPADLTDVEVASHIKTASNFFVPLDCAVTLPNTIDTVLEAEVSKTLDVGKGSWDLELTYPSGDVATVLGGTVKVTQDTTNSQ